MSLPAQSSIRYIDLFAGVGGFHYGLDRANEAEAERVRKEIEETVRVQASFHENERFKELGARPPEVVEYADGSGNRQFTCVYSNEWDKYANSVYRRHYGECDNRDIRTVDASTLPDFDLLCGGFPCQAFSVAGKRRGFDDTRGTLFFEIARILREKHPRWVLLENVKGLLSHDSGNTVKVIFATLDELGYDIQWQILNSKNHGVPQNRERIIIVGHLRGTRRPEIFPLASTGGAALNYIGAIMSEQNQRWLEDGKQLSRNFPQGQRVYGADGIAATLASQAGGLGAKTGLYAVSLDQQTADLKPLDTAHTLMARDYKGLHKRQENNVVAVLTPDRIEKRQNGRRFKEPGEPQFTLTGQDIHGVMLTQIQDIVSRSRPNEEIGVTFQENGDIRPHRMDAAKSGLSELAVNFEDNVSNTISASHEPKVYTKTDIRIRRLTPIECERLQGFPDNWTAEGHDGKKISDTQRYKMMGNAVTTNVITAVGLKLLESWE